MEPRRTDDEAHALATLEDEERMVSARRRRLHEHIDFVRVCGADLAPDQLQPELEEEREVSARRRQLHGRIDELRVRLGQAPGPRRIAGPPGR